MSLLKTFGIGAAALLCLSLARPDTASAADPADQAITSSAVPEAGALTSQGTGASPASNQTPAPEPQSLMADGGGGGMCSTIPIFGGEICCVTIILDFCWYQP